ncbi:hypothetical protein [Paenibacillus koleovorans]|uniref:hypothetical protein n=1 Tax=Paenibacillus koleovorans TaxID=121608 RepID=UPI000FDC6D30|nr:hypothetical protein [Paenibacillus koleovorans]
MSGVATEWSFMLPLKEVLEARFRDAGLETRVQLLHPYGDWNRPLWRQVAEARRDMSRRALHAGASVRGRALADQLLEGQEQTGDQDRVLVLIGHSAGALAAIHTAAVLNRRVIRPPIIIQIGAPKLAVPPHLKATTAYYYGVDSTSKSRDPVTRIGHWGGWRRLRSGIPVWDPQLHAPSVVEELRLMGGHPDYFRSGERFRSSAGQTNLERTMDAVWKYLMTLMN